ncbi:TPA: hypothetical protein N2934_004392 [Vibrio parahaemolyticus]|nr:hypothetical protein [Vibrio parahaemolyticus]HCM1513441.1 hypothetical protein [Vibrio parahaemolyticus]
MDEITYLEVPFEEKEKVKSLGARWHSERKKWFVPKGLDTGPFENWLPIYDEHASQKAISPFYLLQSTELCWKCDKPSEVITFASHGTIDIESDERSEGLTKYLYVSFLPERLRVYLDLHFKSYYLDYSATTDSFYYMNHCQHCKAPLGDFFMHSEPEGAFFPISAEMSADISITRLKESGFVKISASESYGVIEHILENGQVKEFQP